jgi:hypothetical protein
MLVFSRMSRFVLCNMNGWVKLVFSTTKLDAASCFARLLQAPVYQNAYHKTVLVNCYNENVKSQICALYSPLKTSTHS